MIERMLERWANKTETYFDETVVCPKCENKEKRGEAASIHGYGPLCAICLRREGEEALSAFLMVPQEDE